MAQILTPGFLKWDGFKYVLDPDVEGEQGPAGPAGAGSLIFRPGGVQTGNVYTTWTALMAARNASQGPITIIVDNSIDAAEVGAGTWNLNRNTRIQGFKGPDIQDSLPILTIPDGAVLQNPCEFEDIIVIGNSSTGCIIADGTTYLTLHVNAKNAIFATNNASSGALFELGDDNDDDTTLQHVFNLYGKSRIEKRESSDIPVLRNSVSTNVEINLYDSATLDGYTIEITGGSASLIINIHSMGATFSINQPQTTSFVLFRTITDNTIESGTATAFGYQNTSSGTASFAAGYGCTASDEGSIALGQGAQATGPVSVALAGGISSGFASVALGNQCSASGQGAIAIGGYSGDAPRDTQFSHGTDLGPQYRLQACRSFVRGTTVATPGSNTFNLNQLNGQEFTLENGKAYAFRITILAARPNGASPGPGIFIHTLLVHTASNTATIDFQAEERKSAPGTWSVAFSAPSGLTLRITVTDSSGSGLGHNVGWTGTLEWTEMTSYSP